jgi:hypothetical protein
VSADDALTNFDYDGLEADDVGAIVNRQCALLIRNLIEHFRLTRHAPDLQLREQGSVNRLEKPHPSTRCTSIAAPMIE